MYCPSCGAESTFGLKYCKRCGSSLADAPKSETSGPGARNIVSAVVLAAATVGITLGGLGIVFTHALALIGSQPPGFSQPGSDASVIAGLMVVFGSSAIVLVSLMLIKLFARVMGLGAAPRERVWRGTLIGPSQRTPEIAVPPAAMSSVTEHTTRNFEPRLYRRDTGE